jgi:hypothetical protein
MTRKLDFPMKRQVDPMYESVGTHSNVFVDDPADTICCWPISTSSKPVPRWMLEPTQWCNLSIALILGISNAIAMTAHLFMAVWVFVAAVSVDGTTGEAKGSVMLPAYRTQIKMMVSTSISTNSSWDPTLLVPQYVFNAEQDVWWINLTAVTIAFFLLSFFAHLFVFVTSINTNLYMWWIARCRNPLRWIEYTVSASLMAIPIAYVCGIRSVELLWAVFALVLITMPFGWVTEALSRPVEITDAHDTTSKNILRCREWQIGSDGVALVLRAPWTAVLQRLGPWLLGWIPYLFAWVLVLDQYYYSVSKIDNDEAKPPDWVGALLIAEVVVFSCFGVVQFLQQLTNCGCYYYWVGELAYIVLSLTAKMILGITLIMNLTQVPNQKTVETTLNTYADSLTSQ